MIPPAFDYHRATGVADALDLLSTHADPVVLAGGHGLLPDVKTGEANPEVVVDVGEIEELRGVEPSDADALGDARDDDGGDPVTVGALTTHAALAESALAWERAPVLAEAAGNVGDVQVRNRGTVGGNLAEADPAADLPAAAVAADARLALRGPDGERAVPAAEFFRDDGGTALGDRELLTEIRVPSGGTGDGATRGGAYAKKTHPATGYALVGVAAALAVRDGTVTDARLAASGVADAPVELTAVEDALVGTATDALVGDDADSDAPADSEALADAADRASAALDPAEARSDPTASGEFRCHLLSSYAERALTTALDRAVGDEPAPGGDAR